MPDPVRSHFLSLSHLHLDHDHLAFLPSRRPRRAQRKYRRRPIRQDCMLSTLSSFLPPSLQLGGGSQDKALRPNVEDISSPQQHGHPAQTESPMRLEHDTEVSAKSPGVDEHGSRKKKERTHEVRQLHLVHR